MTAGPACLSRRAVAFGLAGAAMSSSVGAQPSVDRPPPQLRTATSQFIELRPLVEPPALGLRRIDGKTIHLNALRGKVVLMSFWAMWCPPCRRELPALEHLGQVIDPRDLEIVAISIDKGGKDSVAAFSRNLGVVRLQPFLDPDGLIAVQPGQASPSPFVLHGMPISYVVDRLGRVAGYIVGEVDWTSGDALALVRFYSETR
jgi:thiol-disulfide isomerase/thioredoxin